MDLGGDERHGNARPGTGLRPAVGRRSRLKPQDVSNSKFLFVYGTLRKFAKHPTHQVLADRAKLIGTGNFQGKLYNLGRFPGVVSSQQRTDRVIGEIYALDDERSVFQFLDEYEGSLFRRQLRVVYLNNEKKLWAWIYLYVGPVNSAKFISSGDYRSFRVGKT